MITRTSGMGKGIFFKSTSTVNLELDITELRMCENRDFALFLSIYLMVFLGHPVFFGRTKLYTVCLVCL